MVLDVKFHSKRPWARVTDIMGEISAASEEQSTGIEQVNRAVGQMDSITQQNAALVEEAAAASGSLEHQGRELTDAVAIFRLDGVLANQPMRDRSTPLLQTPAARTAAPVSAPAHPGIEGWETF